MKVYELINKLDDLNDKNLSIDHICAELSKAHIDSPDEFENQAEILALKHTCINKDGTYADKRIGSEIIFDTEKLFEYYESRRRVVSHPILIDMYCGMIYEFKTGRRSFELIKDYISNLCKIIDEDYYPYKSAVPNLVKRLIDISIKTCNNELIAKAKSTTIKYIDNLNNGVLLASILDKVFVNYTRFTNDEITHILEKSEKLFESLTEEEGYNFNPAYEITVKLCDYYHSINDKTKLKERIDKFSNYCHTNLSDVLPDDRRSVAKLYSKYDFKDDFYRELSQLEKLQNKEAQLYLSGSFDIDIPITPDENYDEQEAKSWEENLDYILINLIPDLNTVEEDWKVLTKYSVLTSIIPKIIPSPDYSGRTEGRIGGIFNDEDGNKLFWFDFIVRYNYGSLKQIIDMFKRKSSKETLIKFLSNSYAFQEIDKRILEVIIDVFLANNHFVFIHLIIPRLEEAFRNILPPNGYSKLKTLEDRTERLKILNDILDGDKDLITSIFGENLVKFFKVILIDRRFLNIRNAVCHGYFPYDLFNEQNSDLLMLIALILANKTQLESQIPSNA